MYKTHRVWSWLQFVNRTGSICSRWKVCWGDKKVQHVLLCVWGGVGCWRGLHNRNFGVQQEWIQSQPLVLFHNFKGLVCLGYHLHHRHHYCQRHCLQFDCIVHNTNPAQKPLRTKEHDMEINIKTSARAMEKKEAITKLYEYLIKKSKQSRSETNIFF